MSHDWNLKEKNARDHTYNVLIHGRRESPKKSTNFVDFLIVKIAQVTGVSRIPLK